MNNLTNKDRYQKSFQSLHLSEGFRERLKASAEDGRKEKHMNENTVSIFGIRRYAAAAAAALCTVALLGAGICYASDLGGIRTSFSIWLNGKRQNVEVSEIEQGTWQFTDENGEEHVFAGYKYEEGKGETTMSAAEVFTYMNNDMSLQTIDGRKYLTYKNLTVDVTDEISADGTLYVHVADPNNPNTWYAITNITDNGFESAADSSPVPGADYFELDTTDLSGDGPVLTENPSDVSTYTVVTED